MAVLLTTFFTGILLSIYERVKDKVPVANCRDMSFSKEFKASEV